MRRGRPAFLPAHRSRAARRGRELRGDARTRAFAAVPEANAAGGVGLAATSSSTRSSPCALVDSVDDALAHVAQYGSGHTEAIVTRDDGHADSLRERGVDAACVVVNASTRFHDGGELGLGAEIGNSTQKLHARGPIGMRELCAFKYVVTGDGHVRP